MCNSEIQIFALLLLIVGAFCQNTTGTTIVSTETRSKTPDVINSDDDDKDGKDNDHYENIDLDLLLPSDYAPYQLPVTDGHQFVPVFVSLLIAEVTDINEKEQQLVVEANYARRWIDYKISKRVVGPLKNATLGGEALDKIWKPDIFIDGTPPVSKDDRETAPKALKVLFQTKDIIEAQVVLSERLRLKLDCGMQFHYYPSDTQVCTYNMRSFSYTEKRLKLYWERPNSMFLLDVQHPNFDVLVEAVFPDLNINGTYKLYVQETYDPFRRGNYSALTFTIKARRKLSYHLVQTYFPSILLILMTWLCFLIPADMVEARIGISMTTVLTLTAMFASVREQAPSVSYTMAIDIWMVFCIFVVFVSLLLFTFTYWMKTKVSKSKKAEASGVDGDSDLDRKRYKFAIKFTKYYAFPMFSITLVIFVIGYWWWLLTFSSYFSWDPKPQYNGIGENETSHSFYKYLIEDSVNLFDSGIYAPTAQETLKNVFGLVK